MEKYNKDYIKKVNKTQGKIHQHLKKKHSNFYMLIVCPETLVNSFISSERFLVVFRILYR